MEKKLTKLVSTNSEVEVNGETILSFVKAVEKTSKNRLDVLKKHGIDNPTPGKWYSQQKWFDAFKDIIDLSTSLKLIGQAIPNFAKFPPDINTLSEAFSSLNIAYRVNHRGGEIGYYKLESLSLKERKIIMHINTPYPKEFDKGILIGLWRKFKPNDILSSNVSCSYSEADSYYVYMLNW